MKVRVSKSAFNQHLFLQQYNCQQGLNSLAPEQNEDPVNLKSNLISHRKSPFFIFVSLCSLSLPKEGGFPPLRAALGLLQTGFSQPGGRGGGPEKGQDYLESSGCKSTGISGVGRDTKGTDTKPGGISLSWDQQALQTLLGHHCLPQVGFMART